jgi:glycosyltransferase involved in cell wall biosynthesis
MKPRISIIVPIYNMENYLQRCLDSLLSQTIKDLEILTVNDGSTDKSLEILQLYKAKDKRIKIINQSNAGVSAARNQGIQNAIGEYIGFVDPDDWVDQNMYEDLISLANENKADVVMCSYVREFGTHSKAKDFNVPERIIYKNDEVKEKVLRRLVGPLNEEVRNPELLDAWGTVWNKLYRADLLKTNGVLFTDLNVIGTNEDSLFNIHALYHAKTFVFLNKPYYHYWRLNTASVTSGYKPNLMEQWFNLYSLIEQFLAEKQLHEHFYVALNNRKCMNIMGLGLNTISQNHHTSALNKIIKLKAIVNHDQMKRSFVHLKLSAFPIVWRTFYFCAKIRSAIGLYILLYSMDGMRKIMR